MLTEVVPSPSNNYGNLAIVFIAGLCVGGAGFFWYIQFEKRQVANLVATTAQTKQTEQQKALSNSCQEMVAITKDFIHQDSPTSLQDQKIDSYVTKLTKEYDSAFKVYTKGDRSLLLYQVPKDGRGYNAYIYSISACEILTHFTLSNPFWLSETTFVYGSGYTGLSYYRLGSEAPTVIPNSKLEGNLTYAAREGGMGYVLLDVATTSTSITYGIYDTSKPKRQPGDDIVSFQKIGERTYIIPTE